MRVRIKQLLQGPGPDEVLVGVSTASGKDEEVVVSVNAIQNDSIEVGQPIKARDNQWLIELPREAMSGRWRIWILGESVSA